MIKCPLCDFLNSEGAAFCTQCDSILIPVSGNPAPERKPGPHLVVARTGEAIPLPDQAEIRLGRPDQKTGLAPDIDTTPYGGATLGVSRRHCKICRVPGGFQVEDEMSSNGTFVNDRKLAPSVPNPLGDGDRLKLGVLVFTFKTG